MAPGNNLEPEDMGDDWPMPPSELPAWAVSEGKKWQRLGEFEILAKAEDATGLRLELKYEALPPGVWGVHVVHGERGRILVNSKLPLVWRRFAIFHELYHLLNHRRGARFWTRTFESMESFENRADYFAWAALWPEWSEGDYVDWT